LPCLAPPPLAGPSLPQQRRTPPSPASPCPAMPNRVTMKKEVKKNKKII